MRLPSYLRKSRHGVYYLRLVLPGFLADILGQQELIRTLDTRSSNIASISGYQVSLRIKPLFQRLQRIMAIDPNSLDPDSVRKLIVDEMDFRPDGSVSIKGVKTSDDPTIANAELQSLPMRVSTACTPVATARASSMQANSGSGSNALSCRASWISGKKRRKLPSRGWGLGAITAPCTGTILAYWLEGVIA